MWPFSTIARLKQQLRDARQGNMHDEDNVTAIIQRAATAEIAMAKMQRAVTDEGLDAIAKGVTARIADIYACNSGGVKQRDMAVYVVVHDAVREATLGEKCWDAFGLARDAYREQD